MGLLDDAIREHLELKRLRGADAGQVAREEQEALGPVPRGNPASAVSPSVPAGEGQGQDQAVSHAGQETTELDMTTVLSEEPVAGGIGSVASAAAPDQAPAAGAGDSLEWEMPREHTGESTTQGEPRHGEPQQTEPSAEHPVEDVLEETPDFLRETPEQERLWFEQRPPRDFDFDK
jgi:hypothetical protein